MANNILAASSDLVLPKDADITVSDPDYVREGDSSAVVTAAYRAEFLSTFTSKEEAKIIRKVDYRILVLFGLIYTCKQVCSMF
jgi:hypothetical protein